MRLMTQTNITGAPTGPVIKKRAGHVANANTEKAR